MTSEAMTTPAHRTGRTALPVLELGIVTDGTDVPAFDEAVIFAGEFEIHVRGPMAGDLAEKITRATNAHDLLVKALEPFAEPHAMGDNYVKFAPRLIEAARAALSASRSTGEA